MIRPFRTIEILIKYHVSPLEKEKKRKTFDGAPAQWIYGASTYFSGRVFLFQISHRGKMARNFPVRQLRLLILTSLMDAI